MVALLLLINLAGYSRGENNPSCDDRDAPEEN